MRAFHIASGADVLAFNTNVPDDDGVYWYAAELDGWDGADVQIGLANRMGTPGQIGVTGQITSRAMSTRNTIAFAPTEGARRAAKDRAQGVLGSIASIDNPGLVTVFDPTVDPDVTLDRYCSAYCNGRLQMPELFPGRIESPAVSFSIAWPFQITALLIAPDPLRYRVGVATALIPDSTPTAVTVDGTAPSPPTIVVQPNVGTHHVAISDGTRTIILDGNMSGVTTLTVAMGDGPSVVDQLGRDRFDLVTSTPNQWWALLPASVTITVTGTVAASYMTWHPAWY